MLLDSSIAIAEYILKIWCDLQRNSL